MFNLIVTVLAIVIMIAVGIAGLSYLGPAFEKAAAKAVAAQMINGGQQLAGAEALYKADNGGAYDLSFTDLVSGGYLSALPAMPSVATAAWTYQAGTTAFNGLPTAHLALSPVKAATACSILNAEGTGVYSCDAGVDSFDFAM